MMTNVKSIEEARVKPNQDVIDDLQQWLKLAKSGKLRGVTTAGLLTPDGKFSDEKFYRQSYSGEWGDLEVANVLAQQVHTYRARVYELTTRNVDEPNEPDKDDNNKAQPLTRISDMWDLPAYMIPQSATSLLDIEIVEVAGESCTPDLDDDKDEDE